MALTTQTREAWAASEHKSRYVNKIRELTAYWELLTNEYPAVDTRADTGLKRLQSEVDAAHKRWFTYRQRKISEKKRGNDPKQRPASECQEYERIMTELLIDSGRKAISAKIHLQKCWLCGEIILGTENKTKTLNDHLHYRHWTEKRAET